MYDFKYDYVYRSGSTPNSKYEHKTVLTAKFSFDNEVPRNQRAEVKKRLSLDYSIPEGTLDKFMKKNYMPDCSDLLRGKEYFGCREVIRITPHLWHLGFNLRSEAQGKLDILDMINLEALQEFVLTGELSPRIEEELQKQEKSVLISPQTLDVK